jgi:hypothetical protein
LDFNIYWIFRDENNQNPNTSALQKHLNVPLMAFPKKVQKNTFLISSISKKIAHTYLQKFFASGFLCQSFLQRNLSAECG